MDNVKINLSRLGKRASNRKILLSNIKTDDDVKVENSFFDQTKKLIYTQMMEEENGTKKR